MLYTYLGISSFFSRHLFCKLGDLKYFNRFYLYQGGLSIVALCFLCLPLARSFGSVVAIFVVYGLMDGGMNGQFSLLILKCVGKSKLNQAWGHVLFFVGLSIGIGPPLAGEYYCIVLDILRSNNFFLWGPLDGSSPTTLVRFDGISLWWLIELFLLASFLEMELTDNSRKHPLL